MLAGAPDTSLILSSTLAAADFCTTGRHAGIVVCANGPEGPSASATVPADEQAAERVECEPRPAARVDLALLGQPHLTVLAPGQSTDAAQFALGVVGEEAELAASRGQLELLAAQAGHALDRVRLTAERSRRASEAAHFQTLVRNAADVIMDRRRCGAPSGALRQPVGAGPARRTGLRPRPRLRTCSAPRTRAR